ncbi:MAG: SipW-dependent-type signal peptide-containing protein [Ruminococcus sp.]|nr:SipW-dependent-type signal peptide-containing protein [Ruminococcus sp.]
MDKKRLIAAAAAGVLLLACGLSVAYFTDYDSRDNVFTVGKVGLELNEEHYTDRQTARPAEKLPKDPTVKNTGINDEYVFLEVSVPKRELTLLGDNGTPVGAKALTEAFDFFAEESPQTVSGSSFIYNGAAAGAEGWVFLERNDSAGEVTYVFGYSRKLSAGEETVSLFDKFALKRFIEEELTGGSRLSVPVRAYGIQADSLDGAEGVPADGSDPSVEALRSIFGICSNKKE